MVCVTLVNAFPRGIFAPLIEKVSFPREIVRVSLARCNLVENG